MGKDQEERLELNAFLENNFLIELQEIFVKECANLQDVLKMNMEDMKNIGIKTYKLRRDLFKAIIEYQFDVQSKSGKFGLVNIQMTI